MGLRTFHLVVILAWDSPQAHAPEDGRGPCRIETPAAGRGTATVSLSD